MSRGFLTPRTVCPRRPSSLVVDGPDGVGLRPEDLAECVVDLADLAKFWVEGISFAHLGLRCEFFWLEYCEVPS